MTPEMKQMLEMIHALASAVEDLADADGEGNAAYRARESARLAVDRVRTQCERLAHQQ